LLSAAIDEPRRVINRAQAGNRTAAASLAVGIVVVGAALGVLGARIVRRMSGAAT
jgi:hypothetical protein